MDSNKFEDDLACDCGHSNEGGKWFYISTAVSIAFISMAIAASYIWGK